MPLLGFHLRESRFYELLNQSCWYWLLGREVNGTFRLPKRLQLIFELFNHSGGGEKAAMVGESRVPDQNLSVFECRNFVADQFAGLRRDN